MAAIPRLIILRPPICYPHPCSILRQVTTTTTSSSSSSSPTAILSKAKKTKKLLTADHHLKRRTRTLTKFDPSLYSRYSYDSDHVPVMLADVINVFSPRRPLRSFVDCTLGAAGHSSAIAEMHEELELYVGLDIDPIALEKGRARIERVVEGLEGLKAYTHLRNFKYIKSVLGGIDENLLREGVDGILMDLGMSSMQVNHSDRGFSVLADGPLDMRMDPQATLKAEDILNTWPDEEVGRILRDYGEESNWRSLQRKIVKARTGGGLHSTGELVKLIKVSSAGSGGRQGWIKTATRVFQALRIAVNDELKTLEDALYACFDSLSSGGRLAVVSFHSLEDRIVKQTFLKIIASDDENPKFVDSIERNMDESDIVDEMWCQQRVEGSYGTILTKRPITPSEEEEKFNRRCRSAKLRVIQKA